MKKLFLSLLFLFITTIGFSQSIVKLRTLLFSSRHTTQGEWTQWTDWTTSGLLIVSDSENMRVKVYSQTFQSYDMIETPLTTYDKDGYPIYTATCIDENGTRCSMVWYHTKDAGSYVIFQFSNLELMYKVVRLD